MGVGGFILSLAACVVCTSSFWPGALGLGKELRGFLIECNDADIGIVCYSFTLLLVELKNERQSCYQKWQTSRHVKCLFPHLKVEDHETSRTYAISLVLAPLRMTRMSR